jgi:hypothetical protein
MGATGCAWRTNHEVVQCTSWDASNVTVRAVTRTNRLAPGAHSNNNTLYPCSKSTRCIPRLLLACCLICLMLVVVSARFGTVDRRQGGRRQGFLLCTLRWAVGCEQLAKDSTSLKFSYFFRHSFFRSSRCRPSVNLYRLHSEPGKLRSWADMSDCRMSDVGLSDRRTCP